MRYTILLLTLLCAACSSALPSIKPYRMDIQQGNIVTSKMLMQLKPGMSKSQARFVMGTPLLQDSFHGDRWDYFYQYRKDGKIVQQRRVILEFENEQLKRVRGDTIPAGVDPTVPELQRRSVEPEKGLWDRLKFWKSDDAPAAAAAATATPAVGETPSSKEALDPMLVNPPASAPARPSDVSDPAESVAPAVVRDAPAAAPAPSKAAPAATQAAPAKQSAPAASTSAQSVPAAKSVPAKAAPAAATQAAPEDDLPPEEEPGYFERMLEKIGF